MADHKSPILQAFSRASSAASPQPTDRPPRRLPTSQTESLMLCTIDRLEMWLDDDTRPGYQRLVCTIVGQCPLCGEWHRHGWNPEDGFDVAMRKRPHCGSDADVNQFDHERGYYVALQKGANHLVKPGVAIIRKKLRTSVGPTREQNRPPALSLLEQFAASITAVTQREVTP